MSAAVFKVPEELLSPVYPAVSIYLPTHPSDPEKAQDPVRLRVLLDQAQRELEDEGLRAEDIRQLLAAARESAEDESFWLHQGAGLALFISPGLLRSYRLAQTPAAMLQVGPCFHLAEALSAFDVPRDYYLFAASEEHLRLLLVRGSVAEAVSLKDNPGSLRQQEAFTQHERRVSFHSSGRNGSGPMFYGQGSASEREEGEQQNFALRAAQALDRTLSDGDAPLVLAATEELAFMLRQHSRYRHILAAYLPGSPDELSDAELAARSRPLVSEWLEQPRRQQLARLRAELGTGQATDQPEEVTRAAAEGRVAVLFVGPGLDDRGLAEAAQQRRLDTAVVDTLKLGGAVYCTADAELPDGSRVAARLRY